MKIKAIVNFSGILSMAKGDEMEYNDEVVLQDLLQVEYVECVDSPKKGVKKNESKRDNIS